MTLTGTPFARVCAALDAVGQGGEVDDDLQTITFDDGGRSTVGVVMPHFGAVTFYSVWPDQVPEHALDAVAEFAVRANTDLHTATLELNLDTSIVSARSGVQLMPFEGADAELFGLVLTAARDDARRTAARHHSALAALFLGTPVRDALQMRLG